MIKRLVAKFMFRAMTIWDALRTFRGSSATLWVPQEGLASPPFPLADGPDVVAFSATDSLTTSVASATAFQLAVRAKSPSSFWELNDTNGINAYDQTGGGNTGIVVGTVTAGVSGPFPASTATEFSAASSGWIYTTNSVAGPQTYTVIVGFATTSDGLLVEFTNPQTTADSNWDRLFYIDTTGALRAGAFNGVVYTIASPSAANDGGWHIGGMVASAAGMELWMDGVVVASTTTTGSTTFVGWWDIGGHWTGGPNAGWPNVSSTSTFDFTGRAAYVATWDDVALTSADMSDLWTAWQSSVSGG